MTKTELEYCIKEYGRDIYSFCRQLTCNVQEADDLYQDIFLTALEKLEKIDIDQKPKSYLLSIAIRIWRNRKRKYAWRKRIAEEKIYAKGRDGRNGWSTVQSMAQGAVENRVGFTAKDAAGLALSPEEEMLRQEEQNLVRSCVDKLTEKYRLVVLLYYMEEQSVEEIARVCGIPEGTAKSRLHTARKKLKKELEVVLYGK